MGNIITNWAKNQSVGGGVAKAVLLCLSDSAHDAARGSVSMTIDQIAVVVEFNRRTVMRALDALDKKFITITKTKKADGTNNPNQYRILCPAQIFDPKPSDTESPSEIPQSDFPSSGDAQPSDRESLGKPDIVTDSHHLSDRESLPNGENQAETADKVTESHLEHSDGESLSTVSKEEEFKNRISLSPRAGAKPARTGIPIGEIVDVPETPETKFNDAIVRGLKRRLKTPTVLPDEWQWAQAIDWAWKNDFAVKRCLKVFDILEGIRLCKHGEWSISPAFWKRSIPKLEQLKLELKKLKNAPVRAGKDDGNIQKTNGKSYRQERDERAVDDYRIVEQARANADRRRQAKLQGSDAAGG